MMKGYLGSFIGGMACAAVLIWNNKPIVIPDTNVLVSPHPHLTPVYYRVFILNHPFYSPHHATPDDNTLGRFFLVDIAPPFTGQRVTDYIIEREHLRSQEVALYANTTAYEPVSKEEVMDLIRGFAPVGNPDEPLMLVLGGMGRHGAMELNVPSVEVDVVKKSKSMRSTAARAVARFRVAPARVAGAAALFVISLALAYAVALEVLLERTRSRVSV